MDLNDFVTGIGGSLRAGMSTGEKVAQDAWDRTNGQGAYAMDWMKWGLLGGALVLGWLAFKRFNG